MIQPGRAKPKTTLFDAILDRSQTDIPVHYLPSATAVLIAGSTMLQAIGYSPGGPSPIGWTRGADGLYKRSHAGDRTLWVQRWGDFWVVERTSPTLVGPDEALVCAFSGNPIWTRTMAPALLLAEHCDPLPLTAVAARWALVTT